MLYTCKRSLGAFGFYSLVLLEFSVLKKKLLLNQQFYNVLILIPLSNK